MSQRALVPFTFDEAHRILDLDVVGTPAHRGLAIRAVDVDNCRERFLLRVEGPGLADVEPGVDAPILAGVTVGRAANLGLATTRELLDELTARLYSEDMGDAATLYDAVAVARNNLPDRVLDYRTVDQ